MGQNLITINIITVIFLQKEKTTKKNNVCTLQFKNSAIDIWFTLRPIDFIHQTRNLKCAYCSNVFCVVNWEIKLVLITNTNKLYGTSKIVNIIKVFIHMLSFS
jgi:hypothetical protein